MNDFSSALGSGTLPDFRALFENTPNLYLVLDPDLVIVAVNDAYCRATLRRREQIVFRPVFEVFPDNPDDVDADGVSNLRSSLLTVLDTGRPDLMPTQKFDIQRPDGSFEERYWSPLNSPVLGPHNEVLWIIHRVEDVTETVRARTQEANAESMIAELRRANAELQRRNSENAALQRDLLAKSEEFRDTSTFLNLVVENIPAMVAVKDAADLRFVLLNRHGEELTGIPRMESLGKNDYDFFPKEQADFFVALDREVLASGELKIIPEERIATRHKGERVLRTLKMPVPDEHGRPRYLLAMSEDITDRLQAQARLRESQALSSGLLEASPDAVLAIDTTGRIVIASERVRTMYGYAPEELIGRHASMLIPPDQHEENARRARKALENGGTGSIDGLDGLRRDGTTFPVEANLRLLASDAGQLIVVSMRDVSERQAVEAQLRQAQKMEAIGSLTGGIAHDFNNLLSVVIGNLDLLREELDASSAADALAHEALDAALRGAELTKRLLAFARRQPLQPRITDVNALVAGIGRMLVRTLGENVEIRLQPGAEVAPVNVDPAQLENCLVNLAANARDAMPRGGELVISTDNRHLDEDYVSMYPGLAAGDYTLIEVADTGAGMDRDTLDRIFEPFFTTKTEGKGTGLGLSMVFGFMKQSGGHINVYSEPDVGTTFRLYLPHAENAAVEAAAPTAPAVGGRETILAVEDNPGLRALVIKQLTALGYRCLEAENGPTALKVLEAEKIDLLFTDVIMPGGMSGYELGREAKTRWPAIKVLLTSGFPEEKLNGNGQPPWNMRLLTKPYRKEDLARILREVFAEET